ncbi:MAG: hypothetical protein WKF87_04765 [Chryseolinea sp.]
MKTKLLVLTLTCMSLTFGYGFSSIEIRKTADPAVFNLTYDDDVLSKVVVVTITDEEGNVIAERRVESAKHFSLPLNFAQRNFGKYLVSINAQGKTLVKEISYGNQSSIISPRAKRSDLISHTTKFKEARYLITVGKGQTSKARVTILDADNLVVYTATKDASNGAAFLLNMKNIPGLTSIQVTDASSE